MIRSTSKDDQWKVVTDFDPPDTVTEAELDLLADHLWDIIDQMLRDG